MTQVAYALRADFEDSFAGGVLNVGDEVFDVAAQLEKGNGYIVVDSATSNGTLLATVLDHYPALKRATAKDASEARDRAARRYAELDREQLEAEVGRRGLSVEGTGAGGNVLIEDLRKALRDDDRKGS